VQARPFPDGTDAVVFTPFELIERVLPLMPRPRKHLRVQMPSGASCATWAKAPSRTAPLWDRPALVLLILVE
ncbi:MAG: hypothetical protein ACJ8F1_08010, partial [Polyangia bacterium]